MAPSDGETPAGGDGRGSHEPITDTPSYDRDPPRADVRAVYPPTARRTFTWFSYSCGHCSGVHLGRARDADTIEGTRRGGCGRLVELVISPPGERGR